jgi:hypothetical protein
MILRLELLSSLFKMKTHAHMNTIHVYSIFDLKGDSDL